MEVVFARNGCVEADYSPVRLALGFRNLQSAYRASSNLIDLNYDSNRNSVTVTSVKESLVTIDDNKQDVLSYSPM